MQNEINSLQTLSSAISKLCSTLPQNVVVLIDEVDKASNYNLFINFLGLLRSKYLAASAGKDTTFYSVILCGIHDIKTFKHKVSIDGNAKLNSPWNIVADFNIDMCFNPQEIASMLIEYSHGKKIEMD